MIIIQSDDLRSKFINILLKNSFDKNDAELCADIFTENTLTGVASHGVNKFRSFIKMVQNNYVKPKAKPIKLNSFNALEQWDGNFGSGPNNAWLITERAIELAKQYGTGCVALKNTNHWMRGGTYGWKAAETGFIFICWANTIPNLPPWGSKEARTGNNPIIFAVPKKDGPVVLDMALSQFSYGKLDTYKKAGEKLPFPGGYNSDNKLTDDPSEIIESFRPLPIGLWKGSGLSLMLDLIASILSDGNPTFKLSKTEVDTGMSQVFIAVDPEKFFSKDEINNLVEQIISNFKSAEPIDNNVDILFPGERAKRTKEEYLKNGIPIDELVWEKINSIL